MFWFETFYGIYLVYHLSCAGSNDVCSQQPVGFLRANFSSTVLVQYQVGFRFCSLNPATWICNYELRDLDHQDKIYCIRIGNTERNVSTMRYEHIQGADDKLRQFLGQVIK